MTRAATRCCRTCARPLPPSKVLTIDEISVQVMLNDQELKLTNEEFLILVALARVPGATVKSNHLMGAISVEDPMTVRVHICHLRRKIGEARIVTVQGVGYRLIGKVQRSRIE